MAHRSSHSHLTHLKTEHDYRLRLSQLEQTIATLKNQIAQESALIQNLKGPANIVLALFAGQHRRQSTSEIGQARQRLMRLELELAELQAEEQTLTQEWERRKGELRQAAELAAKEEAQHQDFKRVHLDEQQLALEERKAALQKKLARKRLAEEEKRLRQQLADLNKRLLEIRKRQCEDESE